jgi:hypothetical protein
MHPISDTQPGDGLRHERVGVAIAVALFACLGRQRTLRAAERIGRSFATEQALAQASPALRDRLERYRVAKVRASLGVPSSLHAAATELVREHRLYALERR